MDISAENPSARLVTQEDTLSLWVKVLPMKPSRKKVEPRLSDIIVSSHASAGSSPRGGGAAEDAPASFPMFSPANENTGNRHVPIS